MVWISNLAVLLVLALVATAGVAVHRNRLWREAAGKVLRRRPIALAVLLACVSIALLDSIVWIGGSTAEGSTDSVAAYEARSLLDRWFEPGSTRERSYSAPLAAREFYGDAPLTHPGTHWMGTDVLGRDVLFLALKGFRVALLIGGFTSLIVIPIALAFGISAGYFGGKVDDAVFFIISTLASIPSLLLLIALILVLGRGTPQVCIALGITSWVSLARLVRAETLRLRELDYVDAARSLGVSDFKIILRHIVPNLMHLVVITFVLLFSGMVLAETILSYLGVGVDGSWGQMIDQAKDEFSRDPVIWWNLTAASACLFGLLLSVNLIGDTLRDVLDPRTLREV